MYDGIKASPFKIPDDDDNASITFFNPERDGWLTKEGMCGFNNHPGHEGRRRAQVVEEALVYAGTQLSVLL